MWNEKYSHFVSCLAQSQIGGGAQVPGNLLDITKGDTGLTDSGCPGSQQLASAARRKYRAPSNLPDRLGAKEAAGEDGLLQHLDGTRFHPMAGEEFAPALDHVEHALDQDPGFIGG